MKNDVEDPAQAQGRLLEPYTFQIIVLVSLLCLKDYFFGIYLQTPWVGTMEQNIYVLAFSCMSQLYPEGSNLYITHGIL